MKDIPDLFESLRRTPRILSEFTQAIPEDKFDVRGGEGFWTVAEHVSHLAQVQPMLLERFERFISEDHPEFVSYIPGSDKKEPDTPPTMSLASALDRFARYRDRQLRLLESADESAWRKTATHPEYESYSLYILTRQLPSHFKWVTQSYCSPAFP